jgi:hypothetical protein
MKQLWDAIMEVLRRTLAAIDGIGASLVLWLIDDEVNE